MELEILESLKSLHRNHSGAPEDDALGFISHHKAVAIPYLTFIVVVIVLGTLGNFLILVTLVAVKVSAKCRDNSNECGTEGRETWHIREEVARP